MTTPTLFTLPPHVRITIAELVATDAAPTALRDDLSAALTAAERDREDNDADDVDASDAAGGVAPTSLDPALATGSIETLGAPSPDTNTDAAVIDIESSDTEPEKPERRPETIDADLIDRLGSWAAANPDALSEAGLGGCLRSSCLDLVQATPGVCACLNVPDMMISQADSRSQRIQPHRPPCRCQGVDARQAGRDAPGRGESVGRGTYEPDLVSRRRCRCAGYWLRRCRPAYSRAAT